MAGLDIFLVFKISVLEASQVWNSPFFNNLVSSSVFLSSETEIYWLIWLFTFNKHNNLGSTGNASKELLLLKDDFGL